MSFDPYAIKCWIFPPVARTSGQHEVRVQLGRGYPYAAANPDKTFQLASWPQRGALLGIPSIHETMSNEDGRISADSLEFDFMDSLQIGGYVQDDPGTFVTYDAVADNNTLLQIMFADLSTFYEVWVVQIKADGSRRVYFAGDIDATKITKSGIELTNPYNLAADPDGPEITRYVWHATCTELAERLKTTYVKSLRENIANDNTDLIEEDVWNAGLWQGDDGNSVFGRYGSFSSAFQEFFPAGQNATGLWAENGGKPAFPGGMWGISLKTIVERIHAVCDFVSSGAKADVRSAFDGYTRVWASTLNLGSISAWGAATSNFRTITTSAPHKLINGDVVRISGTTGDASVFFNDKLYRVNVIDATNLELQDSIVFGYNASSPSGGSWEQESFMFHETGNPDLIWNAEDWYFNFQYRFGYNIFTGGHNADAPKWAMGITYVAGDYVLFDATVYVCILGNINQTPPNGTYWQPSTNLNGFECPLTLKDDQTLADMVRDLCYTLGSYMTLVIDPTTGDVTIALIPCNEDPGVPIPTNWIPSGPDNTSEEARTIGKDSATSGYLGDDGTVVCPAPGKDAVTMTVPARLHYLDYTLPSLIFNSKLDAANQWRGFRLEKEDENGNTVKENGHIVMNPDGWLGAAFFFIRQAGIQGGSYTIPPEYVTRYPAGYGGTTFWALQYVAVNNGSNGTSTPSNTDERGRSLAILTAQYWFYELMGTNVLLVRGFNGITDDSGNMDGPRVGMTRTWFYDHGDQLFQVIDLDRSPKPDGDVSICKLLRRPSDYGVATDLPYLIQGEAGSTSGGTSAGSSTSGGGVDGNTSQTGSSRIRTRTITFYNQTAAAVQNIQADVVECQDSTGTFIAQEAFSAFGALLAGTITHLFFVKVNLITWPVASTETADTEISGLDTAGTPSYFTTMEVTAAAGDGKTNSYRIPMAAFWDRQNACVTLIKPLERTAYNRRILKAGTIKVERNGIGVYTLTWANDTDAFMPCSDKEITLYDGRITAIAWSNAINYIVGNYALAGGIIYRCIVNHLNQAPPNATYWTPWPFPLTEDASYNSPVAPAAVNPLYALPFLSHHGTAAGSDRIAVDFSQAGTALNPPKPKWFMVGTFLYGNIDPLPYDFPKARVSIGTKNGIANAFCFDIDLALYDFDKVFQAVGAGPPHNTIYNRDNPADPAVLENNDIVYIPVIGMVEPSGMDVS